MNVKNSKAKFFTQALSVLYGERYIIHAHILSETRILHCTCIAAVFFYTTLHDCIKLLHNYLHRFMGDGILTVRHYDSWKPKRKIYDPAFNKRYYSTTSLI